MDGLSLPRPERLGQREWRRFCPRCGAPSSARLAPVRGAYEQIARYLFHKQRLECCACGMRLQSFASLDAAASRPASSVEARFLGPTDGRAPSRLLEDLKKAEHEREFGVPVQPIRSRRLDSADD